jgi:hypothetical protein
MKPDKCAGRGQGSPEDYDPMTVGTASYEFTYQKQPTDSYALESWRDVTDPLQGQSIVIPPQW